MNLTLQLLIRDILVYKFLSTNCCVPIFFLQIFFVQFLCTNVVYKFLCTNLLYINFVYKFLCNKFFIYKFPIFVYKFLCANFVLIFFLQIFVYKLKKKKFFFGINFDIKTFVYNFLCPNFCVQILCTNFVH